MNFSKADGEETSNAVVEGNKKDDWVTPNTLVEVPPFRFVYA